jgi:hypothetical protein
MIPTLFPTVFIFACWKITPGNKVETHLFKNNLNLKPLTFPAKCELSVLLGAEVRGVSRD